MTKCYREYLAAVVLVAVSGSAAIGQTISCSGTMREYGPNQVDRPISGPTMIDVGRRHITTPVGSFRITKVEEDSLFFDDLPNWLDVLGRLDPKADVLGRLDPMAGVLGRLDRMTGKMTIIWQVQALRTSMMSQLAELSCSGDAKRLF